MAIVLWEALTGHRFVKGETEGQQALLAVSAKTSRPSEWVAGLPEALDQLVMRAGSTDPNERFATAREMALALENVKERPPATAGEVGEWVAGLEHEDLSQRATLIRAIELLDSGREMPVAVDVEFEGSTGMEAPPVSRRALPTATARGS